MRWLLGKGVVAEFFRCLGTFMCEEGWGARSGSRRIIVHEADIVGGTVYP
jgi:hypothetical protein